MVRWHGRFVESRITSGVGFSDSGSVVSSSRFIRVECQSIFGGGNYVCETAIVAGIIRDIVIIVTTLVVAAVAIVMAVVLLKVYLTIKRTTGRINALIDQVESGVETLKPIGNALKGFSSTVAASGAASGAKATYGFVSWLVGLITRRASRDSGGVRDEDGGPGTAGRGEV